MKPATGMLAPRLSALEGMIGKSAYSAIDIKTDGTKTGTKSGFSA
jgi:hypothetical protein